MKMLKMGAALTAALALAACGDRDEVAEVEPVTDTAAVTPATVTPAGEVCSQYGMLDRNNNNLIETAEYNEFGDGVFSDWDVNDDNRIAQEEFVQCWNAGGWTATPTAYDPGAYWTRFDDNNDGFLDNNEFFGEDEYAELDANQSGVLEANEWT